MARSRRTAAVQALVLLALSSLQGGPGFVGPRDPERPCWRHPRAAGGFRQPRTRLPASGAPGDAPAWALAQYTAFHAWRTWYFTSLFLLGTWFARRCSPEAAVQLALAHPFMYLSFAQIARRVYEADWRRIANGIHAMPFDATLAGVLQWSRPDRVLNFLGSARETVDRASRGGTIELPKSYMPGPNGSYPEYYLQNFHFQTDGWLSAASAATYDVSTEVLFAGVQDAMQRTVLSPIHAWLRGRGTCEGSLLEAGCGTGRLLCQISQNFPALRLTASDLSPYYLEACRARFSEWLAQNPGAREADFVQANMEELPVADASQDVVVCVYVFHELPPMVRRQVAAEFARVLKPGGLCVLADSVQHGDLGPSMDGVLRWFPRTFHEPYYDSWLREDLEELFAQQGFSMYGSPRTIHVTKVAAFQRS